jgi:FkbM family methyltransferase
MKELLRAVLKRCGYRVTRVRPENRFQAMEDALLLLRSYQYRPHVIIDAGANAGQWTAAARQVFPSAHFHLIEPQLVYADALRNVVARCGAGRVHETAVSSPGIRRLRMIGTGPGGSTGAFIAAPGQSAEYEIEVPVTTLDAIAADVSRADRALLKLDLEGHEIPALRGASQLLTNVEVVLTEVQFYDLNDSGCDTFADVLMFLRDRGFDLFDVACLSQRPSDMRLRQGDIVFVRRDSPLMTNNSWN